MDIHSKVLMNQLQNERNFIPSLVGYGGRMLREENGTIPRGPRSLSSRQE